MSVDYFLTDGYGRVVATGKCRASALAVLGQGRNGASVHLGAATEAQWWDGKQLVAREDWTPPADLTVKADGVDSVIVPVALGSRCAILGPRAVPEWIQSDATVRFTTTVSGVYRLLIDPPGMLDKVVTITATP